MTEVHQPGRPTYSQEESRPPHAFASVYHRGFEIGRSGEELFGA